MTSSNRPTDAPLTIRWPWWLHPAWAFVLLTGSMAFVATVVVPNETYMSEWRVPKFLTGDLPTILAVLMLTFFVGILLGSGMAVRGGEATITFTPRRVQYLRTAYRVLVFLTLVGYALWFASAIAQGVSLTELIGVLNREEGAIGTLKENSRPIGGVTTMTQFGPVAVAIGFILRKLGVGGRSYLWFFALAAVRAMFYAERLALIEVLVPFIILAALTVDPARRGAKLVRIAPVLAMPVIWGVFAVFEYTRSWVYYQWITPLPFTDWVSLRLAGYYTTSFNNSALMVDAMPTTSTLPYFTIDGFWNAPVISSLFPYPARMGMEPTEWWATTLKINANPEFNNTGSFLVSYAEFGLVFAVLIWLVVGVMVGAVFTKMTKGSFPAMLGVATLFVGLLELSRFTYWTQGRAFPVLLALVAIAFTYPPVTAQLRRVRPTSPSGVMSSVVVVDPRGRFMPSAEGPRATR